MEADVTVTNIATMATRGEDGKPEYEGLDVCCEDVAPSLVKSRAVVKYEALSPPTSYSLLDINTDLNRPPNNWLRGGSKCETLRSWFINSARTTDYSRSSFALANVFPDSIDDVDVITNAERIKKLLKMPYNNHSGQISMMVHRIGKTLLIDEFDVHKRLLRAQENDWPWLRQFFVENVLSNMTGLDRRRLMRMGKSKRKALQSKNMFSKFLYYSVGDDREENKSLNSSLILPAHINKMVDSDNNADDIGDIDNRSDVSDATHTTDATDTEEEFPEYRGYQRNVYWTFEDIHMLIGTDLPIFGGGERPAVSLRLRESGEPINVLTGLDYWLDNLMCNVPELAMCYHLDGVVQNYDIIKTDDIPDLDECKFSQVVVKDIAQNILSFLKRNAAKEGHTYWLFKGPNDDIVKLYDLTSLCSEDEIGNHSGSATGNPFTLPVAMLLYRVASRMWHHHSSPKSEVERGGGDGLRKSKEGEGSKIGVIKQLLTHCLGLLGDGRYPQLSVSANYLLTNILLPATTICGKIMGDEAWDDEEDDGEGDELTSPRHSDNGSISPYYKSLPVTFLCHHQQNNVISGGDRKRRSLEWRSQEGDGKGKRKNRENNAWFALSHVIKGLESLSLKEKDENEGEVCSEAQPNVAIPLPYQTLRAAATKQALTLLAPTSIDGVHLPSSQHTSASTNHTDWNKVMRCGLLQRAIMCLYVLTKLAIQNHHYREAMIYIHIALKTYVYEECILSVHPEFWPSIKVLDVMSGILVLCGDAYLFKSMMKSASTDVNSIEDLGSDVKYVLDIVEGAAAASLSDLLVLCDLELLNQVGIMERKEVLLKATSCYEKAGEMLGAMEGMVKISGGDTSNSKKRWSDSRVKDRRQQWVSERKMEVDRRVANANNELGLIYLKLSEESFLSMNMSRDDDDNKLLESDNDNTIQKLGGECVGCLKKSRETFSSVGDLINTSLVLSNMGKMMRILALHTSQTTTAVISMTAKERDYWKQALDYYKDGLQYARQANAGDINKKLIENISWDISSSYLSMATQLQDHSPNADDPNLEKLQQEIVEWMDKSLQYCVGDGEGKLFRSATIHHRLASLHHSTLRQQELGDVKKRHMRSLCELHYTKCLLLYEKTHSVRDYLRVELEYEALHSITLAESVKSPAGKLKHFTLSLQHLLDCEKPLSWAISSCMGLSSTLRSGTNPPGIDLMRDEEFGKLVNMLETRMRNVLLNILKLCKDQKNSSHNFTHYKEMFSMLLKRSQLDGDVDNMRRCVESLHAVMLESANTMEKITQFQPRAPM